MRERLKARERSGIQFGNFFEFSFFVAAGPLNRADFTGRMEASRRRACIDTGLRISAEAASVPGVRGAWWLPRGAEAAPRSGFCVGPWAGADDAPGRAPSTPAPYGMRSIPESGVVSGGAAEYRRPYCSGFGAPPPFLSDNRCCWGGRPCARIGCPCPAIHGGARPFFFSGCAGRPRSGTGASGGGVGGARGARPPRIRRASMPPRAGGLYSTATILS
jgi:hypothetical protein